MNLEVRHFQWNAIGGENNSTLHKGSPTLYSWRFLYRYIEHIEHIWSFNILAFEKRLNLQKLLQSHGSNHLKLINSFQARFGFFCVSSLPWSKIWQFGLENWVPVSAAGLYIVITVLGHAICRFGRVNIVSLSHVRVFFREYSINKIVPLHD